MMISLNTPFLRMMTPALALCIAAGVATAQNQDRDQDREQDRQDQRQDQRQAGQPDRDQDQHPLWRHPVDDDEDWRTEDQWQDRQDRDDRQDRQTDARSDRRPGQMAAGATDRDKDTYRTAYWEGYHDGYNDDEFGFDHWSGQWERQYASAYTDGYYDGHYDNKSDYGYDPNYYLYSVAIVPTGEGEDQAERRRGEQRRQTDDTRTRGDRMSDERSTGSIQEVQQRDIAKIAAMKVVRGDVSEIAPAERRDYPTHTVVRLEFQDRDDVTADFGPEMRRDRLPFERGDRVSLIGYHAKSDQGETIVVSSIAHDGKIYKLRGSEEAIEQRDGQSDRNRDQQRQRSLNPDAGGGG